MKLSIKTPDSLELLLDAMCNVFGAVLFMAILFGGISVSREIAEDADAVKSSQIRQAENELKLLTSQIRSVQMEYDLLAPLKVENMNGNAAVQPMLREQYRQALTQVNALADRLETMQTEKLQYEQENALIGKYAAAADGSNQLQEEIRRLEKRIIENVLPENETFMRRKTFDLQPWRILIADNAVYLIGANTDIRRRSSQGAVNIKYLQSGNDDFYYITKKNGCGIPLGELDVRSVLPPGNGYFVELLVEPDGVSAAAQLLRVIRSQKLFYNWKIVPHEGSLLRTQSGGSYAVSP